MKDWLSRWLAAATACLCFVPGLAQAEPTAQAFGRAGQLVPDGAVAISTATSKPPQGASTSSRDISVLPGLLYFPIDNLAIGVALALRYGTDTRANAKTVRTGYGLSPRVAMNITVGGALSVLPQVTLTYEARSTKQAQAGSPTQKVSTTVLRFGAFAPMLAHVAPHFFLGAGPSLSMTLVSRLRSSGSGEEQGTRSVVLGLMTTVGGWF